MLSHCHLYEPGQLEQTGSHRPLPRASVHCTDATVRECAKAEGRDGGWGPSVVQCGRGVPEVGCGCSWGTLGP